MTAIRSFEDLLVWRKARVLNKDIYILFRDLQDYSYKNQILRASTSISNNVAEGFERQSKKDFIRFLFIAKGSCAEVRSMLHLGLDLDYLKETDYKRNYSKSEEISKMLSGLIRSLQT